MARNNKTPKNRKYLSASIAPGTVLTKYPEIMHDVLIHVVRIHPNEIWISDYTSLRILGEDHILDQNAMEYFGICLPEGNNDVLHFFIPLIVKHRQMVDNRVIKPLTKFQFEHTSEFLSDADSAYRDNRAYVLKIIKKDPWALEFASDRLKDDINLVRRAVEGSAAVLQFASDRLRNDKDIVSLAVTANAWNLGSGNMPDIILALQFASDNLKNDPEIVLKAVKKRGDALQFASENLRNDRNIVLEAVRNMGWALEYASENLKNDPEIVTAAACKHGNAIKFASEAMRANRDVIIEVLKNNKNHFNGGAETFSLASEEIRNDREVLIELAKGSSTLNLMTIPDKYRSDRELILAAVQYNQEAIDFADSSLKNDRDFVLEVLTRTEVRGINISHKEYINDAEIMLQCIRLNPENSRDLPKALKTDRDFALKAIKLNPFAFGYFADLFRKEREILLDAIKRCGTNLKHAEKIFTEDREIVLAAVKDFGEAIQFASETLRADREIIIAALQSDLKAIEYVHDSVWNDKELIADIIIRYGWENIPDK